MSQSASPPPAGTPGPHVFVESLDRPVLAPDDHHHLVASLRLRPGSELTASDAMGNWCRAVLTESASLQRSSESFHVPSTAPPLTVAFSLVKGQKSELIVQKLTELGIDLIVVLAADRSVVKWDEDKVRRQHERWGRIAREAAMQSHRVRLPVIRGPLASRDWLGRPEVTIAHFGGRGIDVTDRSIAVGPEGGWSDEELAVAGSRTVSLGPTVLRAETAAIAVAALLSAASTAPIDDGL